MKEIVGNPLRTPVVRIHPDCFGNHSRTVPSAARPLLFIAHRALQRLDAPVRPARYWRRCRGYRISGGEKVDRIMSAS